MICHSMPGRHFGCKTGSGIEMTKDFFLNLSIPGWIFFVAALIVVALAFFYYRRNLPPLSPLRRGLLTVLRGAVLVITLFILLKPVFHYSFEIREKPTIAVLFDNSASMKIRDSYGLRGDSLRYVLRNANFRNYADSLRFDIFSFSRRIESFIPDSLNFQGEGTDISGALQKVTDSLSNVNLQAICLLSDGDFNSGKNPIEIAKSSPVPIFSVAIGDSNQKKDARISGIEVNRVAYAGDEVPVTVRILHNGYDGQRVVVRIREGKQQIDVQSMQLPAHGFEKTVGFTLHPQKPGDFRYRVEVDSLPGEMTHQNNESSFMLKVLKSRLHILLLSGQPTFDQRFLIYVIQQLPQIRLTTLTERSPGQYYEGPFRKQLLDSLDAFIFLGYPTSISSKNDLQQIFSKIRKDKIASFFFFTNHIDLPRLLPIQNILSFSVSRGLRDMGDMEIRLTPQGRLHPVTRLDEDLNKNLQLWQELPPVNVMGGNLMLDKGSAVLLEAEGSSKEKSLPVLVADSRQDTKTLVFTAMNSGGWHFLLQDDPQRDGFYRNLIDNALRWLVNREDLQHIQVKPDKEIYRLGESVHFSGQVFDAFYKSVDDANVVIKVKSDHVDQTDALISRNGFYEYQPSGLPPGNYTYEITATRGDQKLGQRTGHFVIEPMELELLETSTNYNLLSEISRESGGSLWTAQQFINNLSNFRVNTASRIIQNEIVLWNRLYWLVVLLALLAAEWFLRKRWGML